MTSGPFPTLGDTRELARVNGNFDALLELQN
jgi:hypothetical protein